MTVRVPRASRRRESGKSVFVTRSPDETEALGRRIARGLTVPSVVLLRGCLGTGKTTLARGIAIGLGLEDSSLVNSPSFTLVNIYQAKHPIYHVDLYRLEGERDFRSVGIEDFFGEDGVTIVEWADRLPFPARSALAVDLDDSGGDTRTITVSKPVRGKQKHLKFQI